MFSVFYNLYSQLIDLLCIGIIIYTKTFYNLLRSVFTNYTMLWFARILDLNVVLLFDSGLWREEKYNVSKYSVLISLAVCSNYTEQ